MTTEESNGMNEMEIISIDQSCNFKDVSDTNVLDEI